jgi:hypothetical protein
MERQLKPTAHGVVDYAAADAGAGAGVERARRA